MTKRVIRPGDIITKFLRETGGSAGMNVDGSANPVNFDYVVVDEFFEWQGVMIVATDTNIQFSKFLGMAGELTNGLSFLVLDTVGDPMLDMTNGEPVKTTEDFSFIGAGGERDPAAGQHAFPVRVEFSEPITMKRGEIIRVPVADDMSSISKLVIRIFGFAKQAA